MSLKGIRAVGVAGFQFTACGAETTTCTAGSLVGVQLSDTVDSVVGDRAVETASPFWNNSGSRGTGIVLGFNFTLTPIAPGAGGLLQLAFDWPATGDRLELDPSVAQLVFSDAFGLQLVADHFPFVFSCAD